MPPGMSWSDLRRAAERKERIDTVVGVVAGLLIAGCVGLVLGALLVGYGL